MLVVTRKKGESIVVGDGIEITVVGVGRHGIRIGVTAPRRCRCTAAKLRPVVAANRVPPRVRCAPSTRWHPH